MSRKVNLDDQDLRVGSYRLQAVIDHDGHLNLYVESTDGTRPISLEATQDTPRQVAYRVTTARLEREAKRRPGYVHPTT